jgi:hypothetical protein
MKEEEEEEEENKKFKNFTCRLISFRDLRFFKGGLLGLLPSLVTSCQL